MKSPYISKVILKNFRNFKDCTVNLSHKGVIIGENNVGKTNFIKALQLILDPSLSEEMRCLNEEDFFEGLENPIDNDVEILIQIFISDYRNNGNIMAQLDDATVNDDGKKKLKITYKYYPIVSDNGDKEYSYIIFKGDNEENKFTYEDRKYLNIKVIKAIRDVEKEINNSRNSPLSKLIKNYHIEKNDLKQITEKLSGSGSDVLYLDEVVDVKKNINRTFSSILGMDNGLEVSLKTMNIDSSKILNSMKIMMGNRESEDVSLGINNLIYISLMLLLIKDNTIPSFIRDERYQKLLQYSNSDIISNCYTKNENGNYFIKDKLSGKDREILYKFMDDNEPTDKGVTILVIEEPEAHLHPTYQRLIFRDVIKKNSNSVLLTTHSTHITSIADINSIVHLHKKNNGETEINSTTDLKLTDPELLDLQRYIDIKRGEIYLGKGVVLVEGIAEEYLIPKFAEIMDKTLDEKGIIICNINSTNFKPYVKLLIELNIPYVVITDGDYYVIKDGDDKKQFHILDNQDDDFDKYGYQGLDRIGKLIEELKISNNTIPNDFNEQDRLFRKSGFFVGYNTLEVDMMIASESKNEVDMMIASESKNEKDTGDADVAVGDSEDAINAFCDTFNELTEGGQTQKNNFKTEMESRQYWKCLNKIESNGIGKGRFAQSFVEKVVDKHIPGYIKDAISYICEKVRMY